MTLRFRLTAAFAALLVAASCILGWVVIAGARSAAVAQVDERLEQAARRPQPPPFTLNTLPLPEDGDVPVDPGNVTDGDRAEPFRSVGEWVYAPDGTAVVAIPAGFADEPLSAPAVTATDRAQIDALDRRIVTVPSTDGSLDYRVLTVRLVDGRIRVLASPLVEVDAAAARLVWIVAGTAGVVIAVGSTLAWLLVRRELAPVDRMVEAATAIGAGDLSVRVEHPSGDTELGQLASALDEMADRLAAAFAERDAVEAGLRRFVADASHELRTPLATVRGYAELYQAGGLAQPEALDRAMDRVGAESRRMARLVEDLLTLARLDQESPLDLAPVDLAALAADGAGDLVVVDPTRPVSLDAPEPVVVVGDEARLRQVVANLLANARVHTPAGTPVRISVRRDGDTALLAVADDGPGIAPEQLGSVFERFWRADASRTRATGGAGLGLSIVAAVVAAHGGTVTAASPPGHGAVFTVRLPVTGPQPAASLSPSAAEQPDGAPPAPHAGASTPSVVASETGGSSTGLP